MATDYNRHSALLEPDRFAPVGECGRALFACFGRGLEFGGGLKREKLFHLRHEKM